MIRARIAVGSFLGAIALAAALFSWWSSGPRTRPEISSGLAQVVASGDTIFDLEDCAPFAWTDVYIVPPYTSKSRAVKAMGVSWPWRWNDIVVRDQFMLLVFVDSHRVVAIVEHPRNLGDFSRGPEVQHYSRANARFSVTKSYTNGSYMFRPASGG